MMRLLKLAFGALVDAIEAQPIVLVWLVVFVGEMSLNFNMGAELFGHVVGAMFAAVAVLGAYAAHTLKEAPPTRKAWLLIATLGAFALGQTCGWQQMGLRISRGLGHLVGEAGQHNTAVDALANAKAEREKLGTPRAIEKITAEKNLECKSGVGPRCTKLIGEEADAMKAAKLDAQLPELAKGLAQAPTTSDPKSMFSVMLALGDFIGVHVTGRTEKTTPEDVIFWISIFMTALFAGFGIYAPWLFDLKAPDGAPAAASDWDQLPKRVTYRYQGVPAPKDNAQFSPANGESSPAGASVVPPLGGDGLHQPQATPASNSLSGSPINVNLYGIGGPTAAALPAPVHDAIADGNVAQLRAVPKRMAAAAPIPSSAPVPPDAPADRSHLNALVDSLLVFKARAIAPHAGGWVRASEIYAAYAEWAGPRACGEAAFHTLFTVATGIDLKLAGGEPHYADIALKTETQAQEMSA